MKINHWICLVLLIIVLVVAGEALAGGWWLWVRQERFGYRKGDHPGNHTENDWIIVDDFPTELACRQRITERIKRPISLDNFGKDYKVVYKATEDTIHFLFFEKDEKGNELDKMRGEQIIYHICLPETIDPHKNSQKK